MALSIFLDLPWKGKNMLAFVLEDLLGFILDGALRRAWSLPKAGDKMHAEEELSKGLQRGKCGRMD